MAFTQAPESVVITDKNGFEINLGSGSGSFTQAPTSVIITDKNGNAMTVGTGSSAATMLSPGYFFPDNFLFEVWDPANIDPRGGGTLSLCPSWKPFYLPFGITISRYRFQCDGVGTATGVFVYAGLYDKTGALIFDIGKVGVTTAGQYGPGAVHDPATVFFDASRNATSSVTLAAGWYYYGWGAEVATGTGLIFPQMGSTSALWDEQINIDTVGIAPIVKRWGHSGGFDITAGHMPTTIGRSFGGPATEPMNITFFV